MLHLKLEDVPDFNTPDWLTALNEWLRQFNLAFIVIPNFDDYVKAAGISSCYHTVVGPNICSTPEHTVNHMCVGIDGNLYFDPIPLEGSILRNISYSGIFITLEPHKAMA